MSSIFWKKANFNQTIMPLMVFSKLLGLCTFQFPAKEYKRSYFGLILFFIIFSYDVYEVFITLSNWDGSSEKLNSKIFLAVTFILTLSSNLITVLVFIIGFCTRKSFFMLITLINEFDEYLSTITRINHSRQFVIIHFTTIIKAIYLFSNLLVSENILRDFVEYSSVMIVIELFVMFSYILLERIKIINDVLRLDFSNETDAIRKLEIIFQCIEKVSVITQQINKSLGIQMLFVIIAQFLIGVVCVFVCIYALLGLNLSLILVIKFIYYAIYVDFNILQICLLGTYINNERIKVLKFLRKIISRNIAYKNILEVNLEIAELGCGFFEFNMKLFHKIVATQALYFVVMIQFQKMLNP
ncbi:hypothetical protein PVAND_010937 [Polypedilum vanderplanki]|uniref:Gustatory receptor n=1 Tax=Polypedilum vanderplanki TaxID=319348 RepID=A0A9J6CI15_POLVA|nr:hypothetical protein PVAND_010937 [Polypedilum vanderplanki]